MNKLYLAVGLALAMWLGYGMWERHIRQEITSEYNAKIDKQKIEAQTKYNLALEAGKRQKEAQDANDKINEQTISVLADKLHVARLRDPNAGCRSSCDQTVGIPSSSGGKDTTETSGLLSEAITGLLQRLTREADEINNAYISCRHDAYNVRKL